MPNSCCENTDPAADQAREILRVMPGQPDAELVLARALRAQGQAHEALVLIDAVLQRFPQAAIAHHDRGLCLSALQQGQAALSAHEAAVKIEPRLAEGWRAVADHRRALGDDAGADRAVQQYLLHAHTDPQLRDAAKALHGNDLPVASVC